MERPILSSLTTTQVLKLRKPTAREVRRANIPRRTLSEPFGLEKQNTEEGVRDVQAKKTGNIQEKYLLPLHSMHYTNSVGRINGRITPE